MKKVYDNGYYVGDFKNGKMHGKGTFCWNIGDKYEGEWKNGYQSGVGTYHYSNGDKYVGTWLVGNRHGIGTFYFADGGKYEGEWKDDKKHGKGTYYYPNGDVFECETRQDCPHIAIGIATYADGCVQKRVFCSKTSCTHLIETLTKGNCRFVGAVVDGKREVWGEAFFDDGAYYVGEWKDDQLCGYGTMTYASKDVYQGFWKNGEWHGDCKIAWTNGITFECAVNSDDKTFTGKLIYTDKSYMEGTFVDGWNLHGQAKYVDTRGVVYEGNWCKGKKHGRVTEYTPQLPNQYYDCQYDQDNLVSKTLKKFEI